MDPVLRDFRLLPGLLGPVQQRALVDQVLTAEAAAPFRNLETPGGRTMSVAMFNMGEVGWVSDRTGYRYDPIDPLTGHPWPPIPPALLDLWAAHADPVVPPDACLVNLYRGTARLSLHQDADETDFSYPVLSVSLGDTAIFRLGGPTRGGPTRSLRLSSGDVVLLAGAARTAFHGVDRTLPGSSSLIPGGGRINLTLRRARGA
jgi:alkylated DNA repair protein (DNA oxidative demethylase)